MYQNYEQQKSVDQRHGDTWSTSATFTLLKARLIYQVNVTEFKEEPKMKTNVLVIKTEARIILQFFNGEVFAIAIYICCKLFWNKFSNVWWKKLYEEG